MERTRVTGFFIFLLIFVFALALFQHERFGNVTGLGSDIKTKDENAGSQNVTLYQISYFVLLAVLLVLSIRFLHHHNSLVKRIKGAREKDFERQLIKLDLNDKY